MSLCDEDNQQETEVIVKMLDEFKDIVDPRDLPRRKKELIYYLVGFTAGEGCFSVALKKQRSARFGWVLDPVFHITQHKKNKLILEIILRTFKCGRIIEKHGQTDTLQFIVDNRRQLAEKIVPLFNKYKLLIRSDDFKLFEDIVISLEQKEHQNIQTFKKMIEKAYKMNFMGKQRRYKIEDVMKDLEKYTLGFLRGHTPDVLENVLER